MKKIFGLALAAGLLTTQFAFSQNNVGNTTPNQYPTLANNTVAESGDDEKKAKQKPAEAQNSNVYNSNNTRPASEFTQPAAYNRSSGSFTVTKFRESKVAKKIRRGEGRTRFSVPTPKGKPLVHKRKGRFNLFG